MATQIANVMWKTDTSGIEVPSTPANLNPLFRPEALDEFLSTLDFSDKRFLGLMMGNAIETETQTQPLYRWAEDDMFQTITTSHAAYNDTVTTIVTDTPCLPGVILTTPSGERMKVTDAAGNSNTVTRGVLGSTAAGITLGDRLIMSGPVIGETGSYGPSIGTIPELKENYISVLSMSFQTSELQRLTEMRWDVAKHSREFKRLVDTFMNLQDNQLRSHVKTVVSTGAGREYHNAGFKELVTNSISIPHSFDYIDLDELFAPSFDHSASSMRKLMLVDPAGFRKLITLQDNRTSIVDKKFIDKIQATVTTIQLPSGKEIDLIVDSKKLAPNEFMLIDSPNIKFCPMEGLSGIFVKDIPSTTHAEIQEIYTSIGLKVNHGEIVHAKGNFLTS